MFLLFSNQEYHWPQASPGLHMAEKIGPRIVKVTIIVQGLVQHFLGDDLGCICLSPGQWLTSKTSKSKFTQMSSTRMKCLLHLPRGLSGVGKLIKRNADWTYGTPRRGVKLLGDDAQLGLGGSSELRDLKR